jgi:deazaflavin-dependent oxidoreductase (nitroreductase family)
MSTREGAALSKPPSALVKAINPFMRRLAGHRWFPAWAALKHRGRRSGKEYVIPVALMVKPDAFVIGLPWGPQTNWVQNVLAANGCTITWKGREYQVTAPVLVDRTVALAAANTFQRFLINRIAFPGFLQVKRG